MTIQPIAEDQRPIQGISNDAQCQDVAWVGVAGVTEIIAYQEPGQMGYVAFYAVMKGKHLAMRVPAAHVSVRYKEPAGGESFPADRR